MIPKPSRPGSLKPAPVTKQSVREVDYELVDVEQADLVFPTGAVQLTIWPEESLTEYENEIWYEKPTGEIAKFLRDKLHYFARGRFEKARREKRLAPPPVI